MRTFFITTILLVPLIDPTSHYFHVNSQPFNQINQKKTNAVLDCIDSADFYYEIVMGLSTFPVQTFCSDQEESHIASFLEERVNAEIDTWPETIKTTNKVCRNPINRRRRLIASSSNETIFLSHHHERYQNNQTFKTRPTGASVPMIESSQRKLYRRRSFIYVGGGKCRYCLKDNFDHRSLFATITGPQSAKTEERRNLLYLSVKKPEETLPKVADITLCDKFGNYRMFLRFYRKRYQEKWTNPRQTEFYDKIRNRTFKHTMGPYSAGDKFGIQMDMLHAMKMVNKFKSMQTATVDQPVKEGNILFWLYAFDLPSDSATGIFADDPLYLFINGIKLDMNLLMSQPGVKKTPKSMSGESFAGIRWKIERIMSSHEDFAHGPAPDRAYRISIIAPLVLLSHKNQFDLDFIIKPNAAAEQYAIHSLQIGFRAALCEVTGMESSPFEEFQSVAESRLFHKLGMELAQEFQDKKDHCLYDKIPVVNVNLVEKKSWRDSNPHCG